MRLNPFAQIRLRTPLFSFPQAPHLKGNRPHLKGNRPHLKGNLTAPEGKSTALEGKNTALEVKNTALEGKSTALEGKKYFAKSFRISKRKNPVLYVYRQYIYNIYIQQQIGRASC